MNEKILDNYDYQSKLNTYNLSLYARVIEGNYEKRPVIAMDCNAKDYMFLYDIGKKLYSSYSIWDFFYVHFVSIYKKVYDYK